MLYFVHKLISNLGPLKCTTARLFDPFYEPKARSCKTITRHIHMHPDMQDRSVNGAEKLDRLCFRTISIEGYWWLLWLCACFT